MARLLSPRFRTSVGTKNLDLPTKSGQSFIQSGLCPLSSFIIYMINQFLSYDDRICSCHVYGTRNHYPHLPSKFFFKSPQRELVGARATDAPPNSRWGLSKINTYGPKSTNRGGLCLDIHDKAFKSGDSGEIVIKPGDPNSRSLIKRLSTSDKSLRRPPKGDQLHEAEIALLRRWI